MIKSGMEEVVSLASPAFLAGHEHLGIEGDAHAFERQSQDRLDVLRLQGDAGTDAGLGKHVVRQGPDPVAGLDQEKGTVLDQSEIRFLGQLFF